MVDLRLVDLTGPDDRGDFLRAGAALARCRSVIAAGVVHGRSRGSFALVAAAGASSADPTDIADVDSSLNAEDVIDRRREFGRMVALLESLHGTGIVEAEVDDPVGERLGNRIGCDDRASQTAALLHRGEDARPCSADGFDLAADVTGSCHRGGFRCRCLL